MDNRSINDFKLNHFHPLKNWIKKHPILIKDCLQTILELPKGSIEIKEMSPIQKTFGSKNINEWRVEIDLVVIGKNKSAKKALAITIQLTAKDKLADYVEGGAKRKLLEEVLYPNFIGEEIDCITNIKFDAPAKYFTLEKEGNSGRLGVSTQL